VMESTL